MSPHPLLSFLGGSLQITLSLLVLGILAVALDALVRYLRRCHVSSVLCTMLEQASLLLVAIDLTLVLAFAAAHALEAFPPVLRLGELRPNATKTDTPTAPRSRL